MDNARVAVLDGWFQGLDWLPRGHGYEGQKVVAKGMDPGVPHTITFKVVNTSHRSVVFVRG